MRPHHLRPGHRLLLPSDVGGTSWDGIASVSNLSNCLHDPFDPGYAAVPPIGLTDLAESFVAEPGYERTKLPSNVTCDVVTTVRILAADVVSRSDSLRKPGFPFVGRVRWFLSDFGSGQRVPPPAPFAATGFVAGVGVETRLASFVLDHGTKEKAGLARGRWAIVENAAEFAVEPGTTVRITNGSRVVAEFLVEAVDGLPVGGPN